MYIVGPRSSPRPVAICVFFFLSFWFLAISWSDVTLEEVQGHCSIFLYTMIILFMRFYSWWFISLFKGLLLYCGISVLLYYGSFNWVHGLYKSDISSGNLCSDLCPTISSIVWLFEAFGSAFRQVPSWPFVKCRWIKFCLLYSTFYWELILRYFHCNWPRYDCTLPEVFYLSLHWSLLTHLRDHFILSPI